MAGQNDSAEQLIAELLGTGEMNADSTADLERMRADNEAGTLRPDDRSYLEAFHQRIMAGRAGEPIGSPELDSVETEAPEDSEASRIAELEAELATALARAEAAEAELADLKSRQQEESVERTQDKGEGGAP